MTSKHQPFIAITCFFTSGIMAQTLVSDILPAACWLSLICLLISVSCSHRKTISTVCLLIALAGVGVIYSASRQYVAQDHVKHVARYYRGKPVSLRGVVISDIVRRNTAFATKTTFTIRLNAIQAKWGWNKQTGKVLVNSFKRSDLNYGDLIQIEGKLHRPYNFSSDKNFSYQKFLRYRGIYYLLSVKKDSNVLVLEHNIGSRIKSLSLKLRDKLSNILSEHLSHNEAGIMKAILLGDRSAISKPVRDLFVQTGTAHILAISGLHIGVVAGLFLIISRFLPVGRRYQLASVIVLLILYAFLTGGRPSVVRATIMMSVFLTSLIIEKEPDALNTLFLAAMLILVYNPLNIFDVGFQLSFVCVFAIVFFSMRYLNKKKRDKFQSPHRMEQLISRSILISLAIWIAVAGLIAYYFGIITPITIFANLLVVPLISVLVTLGFGLLVIGSIAPAWGFMFAVCLKVALNTMVGIIFLFDKIPWAYFYVKDVKPGHVLAYYAVLIVILGSFEVLRRKQATGIDKTIRL